MRLYQRFLSTSLIVVAFLLLGLMPPAPLLAQSPQTGDAVTPQLFFPVAYNQFQGNSRNSIFLIQNLGTAAASVQVTFYNENGQPIQPGQLNPIAANSASLTNPFTLSPGAGHSFRMDQQFSLQSGQRYAVVVSSDQPLAGTVQGKFLSGVGNTVLTGTYEGFTAEDVSTMAILPVVKKQLNNLGAELSIQNVSDAAAQNVIIKAYNQAGQQSYQSNLPSIPAYSSFQANFIDILGLPAGFEGSVVIESPSPVAVVNHQLGEGAGGVPMRTSNSWPAGATTLYAPFLSINQLGLSLSAALTVMNPGNQPANVTITLSNGNQTSATLQPFASQTFNYQQPLLAATITSVQPVIAVVVNTSGDAGDASAYDALTIGSTRWAFPYFAESYIVDGADNYDSKLMLYNPGPDGALLRISVLPRIQGEQPIFQDLNLPPNQFTLLDNLNGLSSNSLRSLVVSEGSNSSQPQTFFGMVYTQNSSQSGDDLSAYPGIPVGATAPVATIGKSVSSIYLRAGDPVTYTLNVTVGSQGGAALITDDLPDELSEYSYEVSAGLVVTETGSFDYQWNAFVPAGGGVITITGIVSSTVDVGVSNVASIAVGNASAQAGVQSVLDVTEPKTEITAQPPALDTDRTPEFTFTGDDSTPNGTGSGIFRFECRVDQSPFSTCTSPFTTANLSDGEHTFQVRAVDRVGYVDSSPASYTWTVDATAPAVPALSSPANSGVITSTDIVTLTWGAVTDSNLAGYRVKLNGAVTAVGTVTQTVVGPLANGTYTWTVAAVDAAGNISADAAVRTFTVDKRLVINPAQTSSATLVSNEGFTSTITVPAGAVALTGTLEMSYQPIPASTLPTPPNSGNLLLGFELDLLQNGAVQSGVVFSKPITISIAYDSALVSDPSSLQFYYLDENGDWSNDGITIITPIGNPLIATLTHLTDFGLAEAVTTRTIYLPSIAK